MEGVPESALGRDGCHGFLYGCGLDTPRFVDLLRLIRHAAQDTFGTYRRLNYSPNGAYMKQVACNLTDVSDGFLVYSRYIIMDRDTKYTE